MITNANVNSTSNESQMQINKYVILTQRNVYGAFNGLSKTLRNLVIHLKIEILLHTIFELLNLNLLGNESSLDIKRSF